MKSIALLVIIAVLAAGCGTVQTVEFGGGNIYKGQMKGEVAEGKGLDAGAEIDESVDHPHSSGRSLATAEIHGGGPAQQSVGTDDTAVHPR